MVTLPGSGCRLRFKAATDAPCRPHRSSPRQSLAGHASHAAPGLATPYLPLHPRPGRSMPAVPHHGVHAHPCLPLQPAPRLRCRASQADRPSPVMRGCAVPAMRSARSDPDHACGPSGASRGHTSASRPLAAAPSHAVPSLPRPVELVPGGPPLPCLPLRINPFWPGLTSRAVVVPVVTPCHPSPCWACLALPAASNRASPGEALPCLRSQSHPHRAHPCLPCLVLPLRTVIVLARPANPIPSTPCLPSAASRAAMSGAMPGAAMPAWPKQVEPCHTLRCQPDRAPPSGALPCRPAQAVPSGALPPMPATPGRTDP